jgi:protein TonB
MKRLLTAMFLAVSLQFLYSQDLSSVIQTEEEKIRNESAVLSYNDYADVLPAPKEGLNKIIKKVDYPLAAKSSKTEGTVILLAYIDETGEVKDVKVIKDIGFGCGDAAAKAFANAKFMPAVKNGKNISIKAAIPVKFQLYRQSL